MIIDQEILFILAAAKDSSHGYEGANARPAMQAGVVPAADHITVICEESCLIHFKAILSRALFSAPIEVM